jgi:hypothetical protein
MGHALAEAALDAADAVLVMNEADREMLERHRPARQRLAAFPPFLDVDAWPAPAARPVRKAPRLLAVAMMRHGDKLASYRLLAAALSQRRIDRGRSRSRATGRGPPAGRSPVCPVSASACAGRG